ncbi:hypothetical protein [Mucilaginibacter gotjawali]|uniref:Uncharacterized protein n=1 Tax=Mucilaginibacter gotjawali TaxID=1550579 RepID=A0A839SM31_9SPHI|nr:hypothetical protein [Mucilaginibacter gotjawali]MBB3058936.1 hypothetical protein [Mucilaginibacter gotjawali]
MKTIKKPSAKKLLIRFDNELKNLLTNDLKSFLLSKQQAMVNSNLSAA